MLKKRKKERDPVLYSSLRPVNSQSARVTCLRGANQGASVGITIYHVLSFDWPGVMTRDGALSTKICILAHIFQVPPPPSFSSSADPTENAKFPTSPFFWCWSDKDKWFPEGLAAEPFTSFNSWPVQRTARPRGVSLVRRKVLWYLGQNFGKRGGGPGALRGSFTLHYDGLARIILTLTQLTVYSFLERESLSLSLSTAMD